MSTISDSDHDELLHDLIHKFKTIQLPSDSDLPGKIDPKYTSKKLRQQLDEAREMEIPSTFESIQTIIDPKLHTHYNMATTNRPSKIFIAITKVIFHTADPLMTTHVKLMYLRQLEKDYVTAKRSKDPNKISQYIKLVHKTVAEEYDEPFDDDEWLIASKAFFAPIHLMVRSFRVPLIPHVKRYEFSPVLKGEDPIRLVLDFEDFMIEKDFK